MSARTESDFALAEKVEELARDEALGTAESAFEWQRRIFWGVPAFALEAGWTHVFVSKQTL